MTQRKIISTTCRVLVASAAAALFIVGGTTPSSSQIPCGNVPYPSTTQTPAPILTGPNVWTFVSEPTLRPMKVITQAFGAGPDPGFALVAPYAFSNDPSYGQQGALILDNANPANPVWFRPTGNPNLMNTDFRVQQLNGKPVLTFWQGTLATRRPTPMCPPDPRSPARAITSSTTPTG
jgi:hypothetical protein